MFGIDVTDSIWDSRIQYDGVLQEISSASPVLLIENTEALNSTYFRAIPSTQIVTTPKTGRSDVTPSGITLEAGITKIRIYMWLEGQDYDCGDSASGSDVRWDLIFKADRV